jgi:hypothetical protein
MQHELVIQALQALQVDVNAVLSDLAQKPSTIRDFATDQDENEGHLDIAEDVHISVWKPEFSTRIQYRAFEKEADLCSNATDPKMAVEAVMYKLIERKINKLYEDKVVKIDMDSDDGMKKLYEALGLDLDAEVAAEEAKMAAEAQKVGEVPDASA